MSTGTVGEGHIQLYMESRGWKLIEGKVGARTQHFDLVFARGNEVLVTQVKTSSEEFGWIRYQPTDPLKSAEGLLKAAFERNGKAIMILVQLPEEPVTTIAENDGQPVLVTTMPPPTLVTWADPQEFAAKVEHARDEYAKGFYQYGERKGQPLPRTGCGYPAQVDEFPTLESYLARAELDDTQSATQRAKIVRQDAVAHE